MAHNSIIAVVLRGLCREVHYVCREVLNNIISLPKKENLKVTSSKINVTYTHTSNAGIVVFAKLSSSASRLRKFRTLP